MHFTPPATTCCGRSFVAPTGNAVKHFSPTYFAEEFRRFRGKAPAVCLAQPNGLGSNHARMLGPKVRQFANTMSVGAPADHSWMNKLSDRWPFALLGKPKPSPLGWARQTNGPLARKASRLSQNRTIHQTKILRGVAKRGDPLSAQGRKEFQASKGPACGHNIEWSVETRRSSWSVTVPSGMNPTETQFCYVV